MLSWAWQPGVGAKAALRSHSIPSPTGLKDQFESLQRSWIPTMAEYFFSLFSKSVLFVVVTMFILKFKTRYHCRIEPI